MNKLANLGEAFDLRQQRFRLAARETHQRRIHEGVFNSGEFGIEARAQLEQRRDASFMPNFAVRRLDRAGDYLKQSRFTAAVWPDDSGRRSFFNFERDVFECPKFPMPLPAASRERLFQAVAGAGVNAILLGNVFDSQGGGHAFREATNCG